MIKIRHKQTGEIQKISVYSWDQKAYHNHETWEVIAEYNIVQLEGWFSKEKKWILRHRMEREDAKQLVKDNPNDFRYTNLPNTGINIRGTIHWYYIFLSLLLNNRLVLYIKKYAIPALVKIRKIIVAIFVFALGCYLSSGSHFDDLIKLIKHYLTQ